MLSSHEELFEIKGDAHTGVSAEYRLDKTAIGHPWIRYGDRATQCDVYKMDDHLMVVLYCPKCERANNVRSDKKEIRYTEGSDKIDIAPFACGHACGWQVEVRNGIAYNHRGAL